LDLKETDRPERRTALVAQELERFNIDIAALSETRFSGEGQLEEKGAGYTFFWKGKDPADWRDYGVGFAIKTQLVKNHQLKPTTIMRGSLPSESHLLATISPLSSQRMPQHSPPMMKPKRCSTNK